MKPFKVKKVDQNNLIHLLKHMKVLQNMVFSKDHTFKVDDSVIIKIDIQQDVDQSKLQLDCIFKSIIEENPKSEVAEIHKQLGTVLQNIVKKMEQNLTIEKEQEYNMELEQKLLESVNSMKLIAKEILINLGQDDKVCDNIRNKQDKQINQVKDSSHVIDQFLSNKDLGWIQLIFMLLISIGLTFFTIIFIHIW
ncbi:hypothetical protein ABPG72_010220 [Tetrahymena utriculariae]